MTSKNEFWHLNGSKQIESKKALIELLEDSSNITNVSYIPKKLQNSGDIKKIHFFNKTFNRVKLSHTFISGIIFRNCDFEDCLFIGTKFDNCEFHNCRFVQTNTYKISISNTYIDPSSFRESLKPREHQNIGVHLYQSLLNNSRSTNQPEFERNANFQFLRWKRFQASYEIKQNLKNREETKIFASKFVLQCLEYLSRWLWEKLFGSGILLRIFIRTVFIVIAAFTILNYCFREKFGLVQDNELVSSWMEALYYTLISFTTVGYGDVVPSTHIGQLVASVQSVFGFFLFALLASMLFRRFAP